MSQRGRDVVLEFSAPFCCCLWEAHGAGMVLLGWIAAPTEHRGQRIGAYGGALRTYLTGSNDIVQAAIHADCTMRN